MRSQMTNFFPISMKYLSLISTKKPQAHPLLLMIYKILRHSLSLQPNSTPGLIKSKKLKSKLAQQGFSKNNSREWTAFKNGGKAVRSRRMEIRLKK